MTPEIKHAYSLLDVTPDVSDKEMRTAWRKLVRRYHPDLAKTDPEEASRRMAEINAAFDALSYHRSLKDKKVDTVKKRPQPKPRATRTAQRTTQKTQRAQTTQSQQKQAQQKQARTKTKTETKRPEPTQRQTAPKTTVKWNSQEQRLVNAARAVFEGTRRKLSNAARTPTFSMCH